MDVRTKQFVQPIWLVVSLLTVGMVCSCGGQQTASARLPAPTPAIRHRDASTLLLATGDLDPAYQATDMRRLEVGRGWAEDATRLSGYRVVFQSTKRAFTEVVCQVECYLSVKDAQAAYRGYKEQVGTQVRSTGKGETVDESEVRGLGEWGWMFHTRTDKQETFHYLFLRENVLVDAAFSGPRSSDLSDQAIRLAQIVDQRIMRR